MGNIPLQGGGSEVVIRWADGQKQVYTDGGGHDHFWATFDRQGNMTSSGGRVT